MPTYSEMINNYYTPSTFMRDNRDISVEQSGNEPKEFIKSYNYRPQEFIFQKLNENDNLFMGVEIEIDNGGYSQDNAKRVMEIMNADRETVYCVYDGSLTDGFEIVTHPCTYGFQKTLPYQELFEELTQLGYRAHDTISCGLHVHINRDFFGKDKLSQDLKIGNLLYLIEKFWDEVSLISRRNNNRFASRVYLDESDTILDLYAKSKSKDKYCAINLKHEDSVELRVFRGTLNVETFYSTLEFVCLMAEIANNTSIYEIQMVTWSSIVNMFSDQLKVYYESRKEKSERVIRTANNESSEESRIYVSAQDIQRGRISASDIEIHDFIEEYRLHLNRPRPIFVTDIPSASEALESLQTVEITDTANSSIDTLKRKISRMKKQISRCRNELERLSFRRILTAMQKDLKQLKRDPSYVSEYI